ncbi:MAG TPA: hypothetical protein VGM90_28020 [Kofleriaceae bacterium]|jgi:hypothetical protein
MTRLLIAVLLLVGIAARAHAAPGDGDKTAIALLPLDTEAKLELYGQPVATELARAMNGASFTVVVVSAKQSVPSEAKLIVDGTITHDKASKDGIVLVLRIRNPLDGQTLGTVDAKATSLSTLDKAASEVSAKLLPALREKLAMVTKPIEATPITKVIPVSTPPVSTLPATTVRPTLVAVVATKDGEPLHAALRDELNMQLVRAHRSAEEVAATKLTAKLAAGTVQTASRDLGIELDVRGYSAGSYKGEKQVPYARAVVHVRIADGSSVIFDRSIVTDSVLGDADMSPDALARRVAHEVFAILEPNLARKVPTWR